MSICSVTEEEFRWGDFQNDVLDTGKSEVSAEGPFLFCVLTRWKEQVSSLWPLHLTVEKHGRGAQPNSGLSDIPLLLSSVDLCGCGWCPALPPSPAASELPAHSQPSTDINTISLSELGCRRPLSKPCSDLCMQIHPCLKVSSKICKVQIRKRCVVGQW